jgi:hypothetical protein
MELLGILFDFPHQPTEFIEKPVGEFDAGFLLVIAEDDA